MRCSPRTAVRAAGTFPATSIGFRTRATETQADAVADALLRSLRAQAAFLLLDESGCGDLSRNDRIELALDYVDADRHGGRDGTSTAIPAGGALPRPRRRWCGTKADEGSIRKDKKPPA